MKPFVRKILPKDVDELIDFGLPEEQAERRYASMARLQSEGIAALYNILCSRNFAYLADEVGMGKTYQALGLAAVLWNLKPEARIVFISPRVNLQNKWIRDYSNFVVNNYRRPQGNTGDEVLKCVLRGEPLIEPFFTDNLRAFASSLFAPGRKAWFLRHTSFRRPLYVSIKRDTEIPAQWETFRQQMRACGLHNHSGHLPTRTAGDASFAFNIKFGEALGALLKQLGNSDPAIDLLVVDEAQCLRHPGNQGNSVFRAIFSKTVSKWLFLSATPVHSGPNDVRNQINEYAQPDFFQDEDVAHPERMTKKMKSFLVRRPRKFVSPNQDMEWAKHQYRYHDARPAKFDDPISVLAMALVQKKLAQLLGDRNNRYRIGFLSSFESLQESLKHSEDTKDEESETDFYSTGDDRPRDESERKPLDWDFVTSLDRRFKSRFGEDRFLPHPKLDATVELLAKAAFDGNQKFIVFCRRIRAVDELRRRLDASWHKWAEKRVRDVWGASLDWRKPPTYVEADEELPNTAIENLDDLDDEPGFRHASQKGEWLFKYRQTFRDTGRNALFFQENWLALICELTGRDFDEVLSVVPSSLMDMALAGATREYAGRRRLYPADFLSRLCTILVQQAPQVLGLSGDMETTWRRFMTMICSAPAQDVKAERLVRPDMSILKNNGFWEHWRRRFPSPSDSLCLGVRPDMSLEKLYKREIVKSWIGQSFRLTDMILDIYFAGIAAEGNSTKTLQNFFDYFSGPTPYAHVARERASGWIEHTSVILMNCFRPDRDRFDLGGMAAMGSFTELNNPTAVVGIYGGSRINETAIRQFKTPSYPQIIVCTDVLKEGEDLHVFCDQVVHYGVAWTSGDLEQRVGRVDRFFSQIERRLSASEDSEKIKLNVFYPYLADTLEKRQIDLVRNRVKQAEKILDNFDLEGRSDSKEVSMDDDRTLRDSTRPVESVGIHPFSDLSSHFKGSGVCIVHTDRDLAQNLRDTLIAGASCISDQCKILDAVFVGDPNDDMWFVVRLPLQNGAEIHCRVEWQFVHEHLGYALRIMEPKTEKELNEETFSFAYERRLEDKRYQLYRTHKVILNRKPTATDIGASVGHVLSYLCEDHLSIESDLSRLKSIDRRLRDISELKKIRWSKSHKAELHFVFFRFTHQTANLYVYRNMILVVSPVTLLDKLNDGQFGELAERRSKVQEWILDENRNLALGFLHLTEEDELNFCERMFIENLADADFRDILKALVHRADIYKAFLTGRDIN